jgi:hypothetical protein
MKFNIEEKKITLLELNEFEQNLSLTLPDDYKQHMLKYNGGYPSGENVHFQHPTEIIKVSYLHPIKYGDPTMEEYLYMKDVLPMNHLSIGAILGGGLSISLDEKNYGNVFIYYSDLNPEKIANSFSNFINGLFEADEDYF